MVAFIYNAHPEWIHLWVMMVVFLIAAFSAVYLFYRASKAEDRIRELEAQLRLEEMISHQRSDRGNNSYGLLIDIKEMIDEELTRSTTLLEKISELYRKKG